MARLSSTNQQIEKLLTMLEENPAVSEGLSMEAWADVAIQCNELGPDKTPHQWKKYWYDMISLTNLLFEKKRRVEHRSGHSDIVFTAQQERVIKLCNFEQNDDIDDAEESDDEISISDEHFEAFFTQLQTTGNIISTETSRTRSIELKDELLRETRILKKSLTELILLQKENNEIFQEILELNEDPE